MACLCQPRNERLQLNFGLFCLKHRMATLPTLNAEVEYCTQGQVVFKSWTSAVPQGRAAASSSGYDGVKTACKTLQIEGLTSTRKTWVSIQWQGSVTVVKVNGWVIDWCRKAAEDQGSQLASPGSIASLHSSQSPCVPTHHSTLPTGDTARSKEKRVEVTELVSMLPSAKPRFLMLLQLNSQHPSHPRHSSFSREQQQLHPVKL